MLRLRVRRFLPPACGAVPPRQSMAAAGAWTKAAPPPSALWLLAFLCLLAGCISVPPAPVVQLTGDPVVDGNAFLAVAPPRDRVLWEYRVAAAALRRGQPDEARAKLDSARIASTGALASAGPGTEAAAARGTFHAESEKPFIGEPYERVMADFYRAILYWRDGEPDNARALCRDGELIDSDTVDKTYAGDWVLPDWLDGYASAKLGGDGTDGLARARKNSGHPLPGYDVSANVLVFVEYGRGPRKIAAGEYGEQLRVLAQPSRAVRARLEVAGQTAELSPWDDVSYQATTRGGRVMDYILGNKAVFKKTTDTLGNIALTGAVVAARTKKSKDAENTAVALGVVGLLAKLTAAATTPAADTRAWDNLPQYLSLATLRLPPGEHAATLTFLDAAGQPLPQRTQTFTIAIPPPDGSTAAAVSAPRDTVVFRSEVPN